MRKLLGIGLALLLLGAGCGGDDEPDGEPIPGDRARAITEQLDQVADDVQSDRCGGARFKLEELRKKVDALPQDVSQEVRDALADGVQKLEAAVELECEQPEETTTEEAPPTTTEEEPPPTTTEEAPPTTTEEEPPTTTEKEPDQGDEQPPSDILPGGGGTPTPPGQGNGGAGGDG